MLTRTAILGALVATTLTVSAIATDPDVGRDFTEIVEARGYAVEEHFVTTSDGYILGVFRIPNGKSGPGAATGGKKPVALLQHGLLDSSYTWVNNFEDQSLGFMLADAGYDVWFGNARGNTYSRRHKTLDPDTSAAFWQGVDWDTMASQDIPATVEYILAETGAATLSYVGHSQGTTTAFAAFSENAELSSRINFYGALAPVAYVHHQSSIVLSLLADLDVDKLFQLLGVHEFLPNSEILKLLDPAICGLLPTGCDVIMFLLCGPSNNLNASRLDVYVSETPAGTSAQDMSHWAQGVRSEVYQHYDWGCGLFSCENEKKYGQKTPPGYALGNVTVPTALYFGDKDALADPQDVQQLIDDLPKSTLISATQWKGAAHLDFTWGKDANVNVYKPLIAQMAKFASFE